MNDISPNTGREAAIRVLLGEVGELMNRLDLASKSLTEGHALVSQDMHNMATLGARLEVAIAGSVVNTKELVSLQKTIKVSAPVASSAPRSVATRKPAYFWTLLFSCCIASAMLVLAGMLLFQRATFEQARVGRAVIKALPYLDRDSRAKFQAAVTKANS